MCRQSAHGCKKLGRAARSAGRSWLPAAAARHRKVGPGRPATAALPSRARRAARSRSWPRPTSTTSIRGRPTTRSATRSPTRTQRPLYSFKPDDAETPVPDLAEGEPQISEDNKTITVKIRSGVKYSPPVNREVTTKDIKYAFERAFTSNVPVGLRDLLLRRHQGRPGRAGQVQGDPGHQDARRPDDRLRARQADGRHRRRRAGDADHDPGAAGVRGEVRPQEPLHLRPVHRLHGPLHGPQRRRRQGRRPRSRQADRDGPQPQLGREHRLQAGLPRRDPHRGGQRRPHRRQPPHPPGRRADVLRLRPAADRDPAPRDDVSNKDQLGRVGSAAARAGSRCARTRSRSTTSTSARP